MLNVFLKINDRLNPINFKCECLYRKGDSQYIFNLLGKDRKETEKLPNYIQKPDIHTYNSLREYLINMIYITEYHYWEKNIKSIISKTKIKKIKENYKKNDLEIGLVDIVKEIINKDFPIKENLWDELNEIQNNTNQNKHDKYKYLIKDDYEKLYSIIIEFWSELAKSIKNNTSS